MFLIHYEPARYLMLSTINSISHFFLYQNAPTNLDHTQHHSYTSDAFLYRFPEPAELLSRRRISQYLVHDSRSWQIRKTFPVAPHPLASRDNPRR